MFVKVIIFYFYFALGKGGETIKQLQEKSGAKMVIIQDGPQQENEKPLRISGEPHKVFYNFADDHII